MTAPYQSPWAPLANPAFRTLWFVSVAASLGMWMSDVGAAWVMLSLTHSASMVALVQTASALPVFLLGIPCGALADLLDRRKCFAFTQFWAAGAALCTCVALGLGLMTPALLLVLAFANGVGFALRWPVSAALLPQTVPRNELPTALALNSVAFNGSRIVGPMLAGFIIAQAGSVYVFGVLALMQGAATWAALRWRPALTPASGSLRDIGAAVKVGVTYVARSRPMRLILLRVFLFFFHALALVGLLPLVARDLPHATATTYSLLLGAMGSGAVASVIYVLPRARQHIDWETQLRIGTLVVSGAMVVVALAGSLWLAMPAMFILGLAWTPMANSLTVLAQLVLPDEVRARGMSVHLVTLMGATALGAAVWGQVAEFTNVKTALCLSAVSYVAIMLLTRHQRIANPQL